MPEKRPWILQEITWPEVEAYLKRDDIILLPVGSVEQHAHHMPLGTDSYTAIGFAEDAARAADVLCAAPLWYGWATHHMGYPGTVTLKPETFTDLVFEVGVSLLYHGFKKIVIVNGNAQANLPPMHIAANKLANETNAAAVVVDPWDIGDAVSRELMAGAPGGMGHASQHECSQMLHLHPHLCDMSKAQACVWEQREFHFSDHYVVGNRVHFAKTPESFREATLPTGTFGVPGHCTAEKGKVFHETIVANIVKVIQELRETKVETRPRRFAF